MPIQQTMWISSGVKNFRNDKNPCMCPSLLRFHVLPSRTIPRSRRIAKRGGAAARGDAVETSSRQVEAGSHREGGRVKVLVLHGSARRGGDTDTLAEHFLAGMAEVGRYEVRHFYPIDMNIAHCRGAACGACGGDGGSAGCIVQDDMQLVYPALREADVVVLAAPMFWGYMTSQL